MFYLVPLCLCGSEKPELPRRHEDTKRKEQLFYLVSLCLCGTEKTRITSKTQRERAIVLLSVFVSLWFRNTISTTKARTSLSLKRLAGRRVLKIRRETQPGTPRLSGFQNGYIMDGYPVASMGSARAIPFDATQPFRRRGNCRRILPSLQQPEHYWAGMEGNTLWNGLLHGCPLIRLPRKLCTP